MLIFCEVHLRRILSAYAVYYNQARTYLALQKNAPLHRSVERSGAIVAIPSIRPDMIFGKDTSDQAVRSRLQMFRCVSRTLTRLMREGPACWDSDGAFGGDRFICFIMSIISVI